MPSLIAPWQNAKVLLPLIDRVLPDKLHVIALSPLRRDGVINREGTCSLRCVLFEGGEDALQPWGVSHGSEFGIKVRDVARSLRRSWDLVAPR